MSMKVVVSENDREMVMASRGLEEGVSIEKWARYR